MMKKAIITLFVLAAVMQEATAQNTIESIREVYQGVYETVGLMNIDFPEGGIPPEYYHLDVRQNLPGTGPHHEDIRMYYGEEEPEEEGDPYPPHFLRLVTAKYNFAAREFYEEYLYDERGQVMFIYALTCDADENMVPHELRLWYDGPRLLRFTAKRGGQAGTLDEMRKATYNEVYSGTEIPEKFQAECNRCEERAKKFLTMFKAIDERTYL